MKTKKVESLDELVFSNRNQSYGAFYLRRTYQKRLFTGLAIAIFFFIVSVGIPMMKSYYHRLDNFLPLVEVKDSMIVLSTLPEEKVIIPDLPKTSELEEKIKPQNFIPTTNLNEVDTVGEGRTEVKIPNENAHYVFSDSSSFIGERKIDVIDQEDHSKPELIVTEYPEYPGGEDSRLDFLYKNINYPRIAKETGVQGTVFLSFVVNKNGTISDVEVQRGIGGGCDEEATRVVKMMPTWTPGKQSGKAVRVKCTMQVKFTLLN